MLLFYEGESAVFEFTFQISGVFSEPPEGTRAARPKSLWSRNLQIAKEFTFTFTRKKITRKRTYGFRFTYVNSGLPGQECTRISASEWSVKAEWRHVSSRGSPHRVEREVVCREDRRKR